MSALDYGAFADAVPWLALSAAAFLALALGKFFDRRSRFRRWFYRRSLPRPKPK